MQDLDPGIEVVPAESDLDVESDASVEAEESAQRTFSTSLLISAVRCLFTYAIFPFAAPLIGIAAGVGSTIGVVTSLIAIAANLWSIKRFHASSHPWRWWITALNVSVISLLMVLLVIDLTNLF